MFGFSSKTKRVSPRAIIRKVGLWWVHQSHIVFLILFLGVVGIGVFSWYRSLHLFRWSTDQEQEYRLSRDTQVKFQRDRFQRMLQLLDERAEQHQKPHQEFRDIFFLTDREKQ